MNLISQVKAFVEDRPQAFVCLFVGVLTVVRLICLFFYESNLGPDEAQYWFWSQTIDWGYYSKPPMIAWVIALPTAVFGDHEWSVRLLSPVLIGAAALFLYAAARRLYGDRVGVWAAVLWMTIPAVYLGGTLMSTDIPLLLCWSAALFSFISLCEARDGHWRWGIALGAAIGFGLLSKYAMIYFVLGTGLALIVSSYARQALKGGALVIAVAVGGLIFAPNIIWNAQNGFQTVAHTADNANWNATLLNPEELIQFVGDQFAVVGPLLFAALLFGVATIARRQRQAEAAAGKDRLLLSFILPPLIIISVQALLSRAHANWALTAYPAAVILLSMWMIRARARWVLWGSLGLHSLVGVLGMVVLLNFSLADALGRSNDVKRLRGWPEQTAELRARAEGFDAVIVDERELAAHLVWEWRDDPIPLQVFDLNRRPDNTYEHAFPAMPQQGERYLLVTPFEPHLCAYEQFSSVSRQEVSFIDLFAERRGQRERTLHLVALEGFVPDHPRGC